MHYVLTLRLDVLLTGYKERAQSQSCHFRHTHTCILLHHSKTRGHLHLLHEFCQMLLIPHRGQ